MSDQSNDLYSVIWRGHADQFTSAWADESVTGPLNVDAVRNGLFGWQAVEGRLTATLPGGETLPVPSWKAIIHGATGRVLGIPKGGYQIHQFNDWLLGVTSTIVDADLTLAGAGFFRYGALAFVQVEMAETISGPEGVDYRPYLTAATAHDGSISTTWTRGITAVVCSNSLAVALTEGTAFKVKHTRNSEVRIGEARAALDVVYSTGDDFDQQVRALLDDTVSERRWQAFLDAYTAPTSATPRAMGMARGKRADLQRLWNEDPMVAPWKGSAYGVLAATNTWRHHLATVRGVERGARNVERAVLGGGRTEDTNALKVLAKV